MGSKIKGVFIVIAVIVVLVFSAIGGAIADRAFNIKGLDGVFKRFEQSVNSDRINQKVVTEESVVIDVVKEVSPSVVTVQVQTPRRRVIQFSPFGGFSQSIQGGQPQDIGSGFIISKDGLIVTNKHVVSDSGINYKVVTSDNKEYDVKQISRDPSNDIAILKVEFSGNYTPVVLGDSSNLQVGQFVIAIGTALGEFRNTVTTGVVSGLGRGITAGSVFQGYVEQIDNVIQTDAAINSGNSGGPLLNSQGQVIGINVAVASDAQNIGFAIPVNVVKTSLEEFNKTGNFSAKAYLGVEYQMISRQSAIMNDLPQGAYVVNVVSGSPADNAGIKTEDIIIKIGNDKVADQTNGLSDLIKNYKAGDEVEIELWRDENNIKIKAVLSEYQER